MVLHVGRGEVELVGGLDVGGFLEHGHQLRQIEEPGKARPRPVAGSLRGQLNGRRCLAEDRRPIIEVHQVLLPQQLMLQIPLHGIKLCHGVADRGSGGEHDALATRDLVHVAAFEQHIGGFLRVRCG